jgi:hypothetical protein
MQAASAATGRSVRPAAPSSALPRALAAVYPLWAGMLFGVGWTLAGSVASSVDLALWWPHWDWDVLPPT